MGLYHKFVVGTIVVCIPLFYVIGVIMGIKEGNWEWLQFAFIMTVWLGAPFAILFLAAWASSQKPLTLAEQKKRDYELQLRRQMRERGFCISYEADGRQFREVSHEEKTGSKYFRYSGLTHERAYFQDFSPEQTRAWNMAVLRSTYDGRVIEIFIFKSSPFNDRTKQLPWKEINLGWRTTPNLKERIVGRNY